MKKVVILALFLLVAFEMKSQLRDKLSVAAMLGTGAAMDEPASNPLEGHLLGYYELNKRFSVGAGIGVSFYEKTLIPLYADVRFHLCKLRRFTPFLEYAMGYGFAPSREANGGMYLSPSLGVRHALLGKMQIWLSAGYERQKLERTKRDENPWFKIAYAEQLTHQSLVFRIGFAF